jgi:type I restriction enzyme S subunit
MKFPPYPKYKPSGVEWLGDVPEHWEVKRLKMAAHLTDKKVEADNENPVPYIGMENIESWTGRLLPIDPNVVPTGTANAFKVGHTLFGKLRPYLAKACNPDFDGLCSTELLVLNGVELDRVLLRYALLSDGFIKLVDSSTYGSKMPRASWDFIGNCEMPIPPPAEQQAIAGFLDRETGRLDRLVGRKRELIERLKEKRTALISRTVTRGLPPAAARAAGLPENPPLKPSGISWLGDIPSHWEVWKHAHLFTSSMGQTILKEQVADSGRIPVLSATEKFEIFGYLDSAMVLLNEGDLVIPARGNSIGHVKLVRERSTTTQTTIYSKHLTKKVAPKFAFYFLLGHRDTLFHFDRTAIPQLTVNQVSTNPFLLPPLPEQAAIAAYLDRETAELDALVAKVEAAIERLQEYRTALITAAVTGKIDVRKAAATSISTTLGAEVISKV